MSQFDLISPPLRLTVLSTCSNIPAAAPLLVVFAVLVSVAASPQLALQGPLTALCWLHLGQTKKKTPPPSPPKSHCWDKSKNPELSAERAPPLCLPTTDGPLFTADAMVT